MKNRFWLCVFTIVLVLALSIGLVFVRRAVVITKLTNLSEKTIEKYGNNFYTQTLIQSTEFAHLTKKEIFVKNNDYLVSEMLVQKDNMDVTRISTYDINEEKVRTIVTDNYKVYSKYDGDLNPKLNVYVGSLKNILKTSVRDVTLNGIKCYAINNGVDEFYVDATNGLIIKQIYLENNSTYEFEYNFENLQDLVLPDLTEFELIEKNTIVE